MSIPLDRSVNSRKQLYAAIERAMAKFPDLRVGQLLCNAFAQPEPQVYYVEDVDLAAKIDLYTATVD